MTTKKQYADQCRAENPKPLYATMNGEQVELSNAAYEETITAWAEMRVEQDALETERATAETAAASGRTKLAALGLTDDEINALLGA